MRAGRDVAGEAVIALVAAAFAADVHRYAIVVGANEGLERDESLVFAEADADRVAEVLVDYGDVRSEDVLHLRNVDADRMVSAIEDLGARIARREDAGETLLFFYYSGHGDEHGLHTKGTELPFPRLVDALGRLAVDVQVLVVDACQSGELTRLKGARPAEPFDIQVDDRLDTEGMAIITSGSIGEDAQESDRLQGGVFTHHFVAGLKGAADASGDHRITLNEAYQYGYAETVKSTSRARFVQHPKVGMQLSGKNDLVLTRVGDPGRNAMFALSGSGQWWVMEGGDGGDLVAEVSVTDQALLAVRPGDYLVRHRDPHGIRESELTVARGETTPLAVRSMTLIPPGQSVRKGLAVQRGPAVAVLVGGGIVGATSPGIGLGPAGSIGVMADLEPLTLITRVTGSWHQSDNAQLTLRQSRFGADLAGVKKIDLGPTAFGLGVRVGGDGVLQWFDTPGEAPPRSGATARIGPVLSLDVPIGRNLAVIGFGTDVQLYDRYDAATETSALDTAVVPTLQLELARYVR